MPPPNESLPNLEQVLTGIDVAPGRAASAAATLHSRVMGLEAVQRAQWEALAAAPLEANGFFDPGFVLASARHARGGRGAQALVAMAEGELSGLLPVMPASRVYRLPLPVLVATQPYNLLTTPLLWQRDPVAAAGALIDAAAASGAALLVLPMLALQGPARDALQAAIDARGLDWRVDASHQRAVLETELDDETYLRSGLGAKKLKELRRQGHRLDELGAVAVTTARAPEAVAPALERFLTLEAKGWKGRRGTGLGQHAGDARFVRSMAADLSARGAFEVTELMLDGRTIAAGLVIRQADRALFFKIAYDETLARLSIGVQLTLALTRAAIADPTLRLFDSTASADHPMIDHLWRERLSVGDLYIQTRANDPIGPLLGRLIRLRRAARDQVKRLYHHIRNRLETSP